MPTSRTNFGYATGVAVYLVFVCWLILGWGGPQVTATVASLGFVAFCAATCACTVAAAISGRGSIRLAWAALTVGFLGWVLGSAVDAYYELALDLEPPFPSVADLGYLTLPLAVVVVWLLRTTTDPLSMFRQLMDGLVISSALFVVVWVAVLDRLFTIDARSTMDAVLTAIYPISALTMVTLSMLVLTVVRPGRRQVLGLFTTGLAAIALGEVADLYIQIHDSVDSASEFPIISKVTGLLMVSAGAYMSAQDIRTPRRDDPRPSPMTIIWLPYAPMPFAIIAAVVHLWPNANIRPVLLGSTILVISALVRQLTVLVENRRLLDEVAAHAFQDPLTGLANRLLFTDRLEQAVARQRRGGRPTAVLSLDLDDFKLVNDNLGHHCGDELLRDIAGRLVACLPSGQTVARLGGDEFAVIIEDGSLSAEEVAAAVVRAFDEVFDLGGHEVYIRPSIGLAVASATDDVAVGTEELLRQADIAMYVAKRSGVGGVQRYTAGMEITDTGTLWEEDTAPTPVVPEITLLGQLRRVVDGGALRLAYQPQISLATGEMIGVEALVRWPHPELGLLTPNQFLPLIRRSGLMAAMTDLVVEQAARDAAAWHRLGGREIPVSVNLFAPSFDDATLPERIGTVLARHGLTPTSMTIEITEHYLLANVRQARHVIEQLRAAGFRVSIDDFGSGYATMSYLRDLPVDELKLDRHFVSPMLENTRAAAIVHSIVTLAHTLGITSVAEGVADADTAELLRGYGCAVAQGTYFGEAVYADALPVSERGITGPAQEAPPSAV